MATRPDGTRVFNQVAERYAASRPGYPAALVGDVITLSHLPPDGRLLEIGCGPGTATISFAERGCAMLCLDPGPDLIAHAQERVRAYPQVHFVVSRFEDWPVEEGAFDLVIAASSFHWVDPAVGFPKVAAALKQTGAFAVFRNGRSLADPALADAIEAAQARYAPGTEHRSGRPHHLHDPREAELRATGLFRDVLTRSYPWSKDFTAEEYVHLLDTYSGHHTLPEAQREALSAALQEIVHQRGGVVTVAYTSTLYLATQ